MRFLKAPEGISDLPVAVLTFAATVLGLIFNLGFFTGAGLRFITLFTLSEHLVFSLTFALYALIFAVLTGSLTFVVFRSRGQVIRGKVDARYSIKLFDYGLIVAIITVLPLVIGVILFFNSDRGLDSAEVLLLLSISLTGVAFLSLIRAIMEDRLSFIVGATALAVVVSFLFGYYYAASVQQPTGRLLSIAFLQDGTERQLVRGGERFSLVLDDDRTVAVPTESILRIERR